MIHLQPLSLWEWLLGPLVNNGTNRGIISNCLSAVVGKNRANYEEMRPNHPDIPWGGNTCSHACRVICSPVARRAGWGMERKWGVRVHLSGRGRRADQMSRCGGGRPLSRLDYIVEELSKELSRWGELRKKKERGSQRRLEPPGALLTSRRISISILGAILTAPGSQLQWLDVKIFSRFHTLLTFIFVEIGLILREVVSQ